MRDVNSYMGKGMDRKKLGRNLPRPALAGSFTYTFSDTFFIRETVATCVLFGSRLSKISIR